MSKIRPIREEPNWLNKTGVALVYIVFGWVIVTSPPIAIGNLLSLFLLLGILVWALILRQRTAKYFVRFHITQALLLNITLGAIIWLFATLLSLLSVLPGIHIIGTYISTAVFDPMNVANLFQASAKDIFVMSIALVMSFYAFRSHYTELPWITDGVRHWV